MPDPERIPPRTFSEGDRRRLHELLSAAADGRLDGAGSDEVRQLLSDPQAQECYVNFALLEACLDLAGMECAAAPPTPRSAARDRCARRSWPGSGFLDKWRGRERYGYRRLRFNVALALVLSLLFSGLVAGTGAVVSMIMLRNGPQPEVANSAVPVGPVPAGERPTLDQLGTDEDSDDDDPALVPPRRHVADPVARLARTVDCTWEVSPPGATVRPLAGRMAVGEGPAVTAADVPEAGDDLAAGQKLALKTGLAEIVFRDGARAVLQGPATLYVRSQRTAFLERGKCAVSVEDARVKGFEIGTRGMKYTDLGTEFGVLVAATGEQEVHVFRGKVRAEQGYEREKGRGGEEEKGRREREHSESAPLVLAAHQAVRVAAPNAAGEPVKPVEFIAANVKEFVRALPPPTALDLVDIVAGGDGLSTRRNREINPTNGRFGNEPGGHDNIVPGEATVFRADHQYHRVPGCQFIDGVFVVHGGNGPVQLDSAGHSFADFARNDGRTVNMIQAAGATPARPSAWFTAKQNNLPQLGGVDYSSIGHGVLEIRGNKGITFDLAAIRAAHPGYRLLSFAAVAGNSCRQSTPPRPGTFWVFVDGQLRFQQPDVAVNSGPVPLEVPLQPADRQLTLVATTTAAGIWNGTMFGDPKLKVAAIDRSPADVSKAE